MAQHARWHPKQAQPIFSLSIEKGKLLIFMANLIGSPTFRSTSSGFSCFLLCGSKKLPFARSQITGFCILTGTRKRYLLSDYV